MSDPVQNPPSPAPATAPTQSEQEPTWLKPRLEQAERAAERKVLERLGVTDIDAASKAIRHELGYNVLTVNAEPYIGHVSLFEQIVQPYTQQGASTTSSTAVTAAYEFTPVSLALTSPTGFSIGDRVVIDIDDRQEIVTAQNLVGSNLTVLLMRAHTGTYPVTVEGGESIVREILGHIRRTKAKMAESYGTGSLRKVDEIEFFGAGSGQTYFGVLGNELSYWRDELASALGIQRRQGSRSAGSTCSVY